MKDETQSAPRPWVERREIGPCTLYLGDCLAMLAAGQIPTEAAIVSDPPYGINYSSGAGGFGNLGFRELKPKIRSETKITGDSSPFDPSPWIAFARSNQAKRGKDVAILRLALLGADHFSARLPEGTGAMYCWDKSCGGGPQDSYSDAEFIWIGVRSARRIYRHLWKGMLRGGTGRRLHVSEKPVGLMMWMIETVRTPVGSLVCDPYMGSGTTGLACLATGRSFLGIEIDPDHFATACARIERAWAKQCGDAGDLPPSPLTPHPSPLP